MHASIYPSIHCGEKKYYLSREKRSEPEYGSNLYSCFIFFFKFYYLVSWHGGAILFKIAHEKWAMFIKL